MEPFLQTVGLRKTYPGVIAVAELSLAVRPGEVVGLLGPNGAGKTTALRMMAAILTPTAGQALICGHDTRTAPLAAKRHLGFLSGDTALYKRLTPREMLRYFGQLHELPAPVIAERSARLIEQLRMQDFADRYCANLSSGQLQKANIARTLLHDPPVLILDEPTKALDLVTGRFLLEAIQTARAAQKAILFSTHSMDEAEYLCDRLVLLHHGRVRATGTLAEVKGRSGRDNLTDTFLSLVEGED